MDIKKIIDRVILQIKVRRKKIHPIQVCVIIRDVLRKYDMECNVVKGYLIMENSTCFTYFWIKEADGTKHDVLRAPNPPFTYFLSETKMNGVECIDEEDYNISSSIKEIWSMIDTPTFFSRELSQVRKEILKKHKPKKGAG